MKLLAVTPFVLALLAAATPSMAFVVPSKSMNAGTAAAAAAAQHQRLPSPIRSRTATTSTTTTLKVFLPTFVDGALTTASSASSSMTASPLFEYFLQTVISYAVPSFFTIITLFFAAASFRNSKSGGGGGGGGGYDDFGRMDAQTAVSELYSDLYGDSKEQQKGRGGGGGFSFGNKGGQLNKTQRRNLGIPSSEYLKITKLNERYDSYDFSLATATNSKAYAASKFRSRSFDRALQLVLNNNDDTGENNEEVLPAYAKTMLLEAEQEFLTKGKSYIAEIQALEGQLAGETIDSELKRLGMDKFELDPKSNNSHDSSGVDEIVDAEVVEGSENNNKTTTETTTVVPLLKKMMKTSGKGKSNLLQEISKLQRELKQAELDFLQNVIAAVGTKRGVGIRAALLGDIAARGSGGLLNQLERRPLSAILQATGSAQKKTLFVMRFPGDVQASQLEGLREEVTAIIRNSKPGDEAMVVLQSGGGTVTGYGLAAGQLVRLKEAGLFLTMAVEQVAASGGYMMACVADRIVASPFAVLGSIGVISEIPNAYERLKQEGIEFQTVTAGKFKRTLTPTKKINKADVEKSKEDLEQVLGQFSGFVKEMRPSLDIDSVATGETWFGKAALDKGLCDDIKTVDDVLLNYVDLGYDVLEIKYSPPVEVPQGLAQLLPFGAEAGSSSLPRRAVRWMVDAVADEVKAAIDEKTSVQQRYMAKDDTSDRVQMKD